MKLKVFFFCDRRIILEISKLLVGKIRNNLDSAWPISVVIQIKTIYQNDKSLVRKHLNDWQIQVHCMTRKRMHSSRMRTARPLTIVPICILGGWLTFDPEEGEVVDL